MSRPSSIYRPRNSTIHRRRSYNIQHDPFPILDFKEISICLQSCEFIANEELVSRPTSQYIKSLTEQLLDTFMGVSPSNLESRVVAVSQKNDVNDDLGNDKHKGNGDIPSDHGMEGVVENGNPKISVNQEYKDNDKGMNNDTTSTLSMIVLFRNASKFYQMCGINDFNLMDLMRPDPIRIKRILSAVVNFARFREENSINVEEFVNLSEINLDKVKKIDNDNIMLQNKVEELTNKINSKSNIKQINIYNSKLESELKKLKKQQDILTFEHSQYKNEKQRLIERVEDQNYLIIEIAKEIEKFKDYEKIDIQTVNNIIEDLKTTFNEQSSTLSNLELKQRNILIVIESFQLIESDLKNLYRILEDIVNDINERDELNNKLTKHQEFYNQQQLTSNDLNRQIQQLKRQLNNLQEKIEKLKNQSNEKNISNQEKLTNLKLEYDKSVEERNEKEKQLNKRKEEIYEIENQINLKKIEFQNEVKNSEDAVLSLNNHIKLYLAEMNKKLGS